MSDSNPKLFSDFQQVTREEWKEKIITDLKGADYQKKMVWRTLENFDVDPFYMPDDLSSLEYLKNYQNNFINKEATDTNARVWKNLENIEVQSAQKGNLLALEALKLGADGLDFDLGDTSDYDLSTLLNGIDMPITAVNFTIRQQPVDFLEAFVKYLNSQNYPLDSITGSINFDPIGNSLINGKYNPDSIGQLAKMIGMAIQMPRFKVLTVNGRSFYDSGANIADEIGFTLGMVVDYLDKLTEAGVKAEDIFNTLCLNASVGTNYFLEVAKLRALRILIHQLAVAYGYEAYDPGKLTIHSYTAIWSKTIYDPYVNMLRNTTEAMSAVIGGCNYLTIMPFDEIFEVPTSFSRRISRNISIILKEESYFDKVADPAAGSYYVETITDKLVENGWKSFQDTEGDGGFMKAFQAGKVKEKINAAKSKKLSNVNSRRDVLVGVNQYPNQTEFLDPRKLSLSNGEEDHQLLKPSRAAEVFENLRLKTDKFVVEGGNKRPKVYLTLLGGNAVMRKARASFSAGFLGCAGFIIEEGLPNNTLEDALDVSSKANAEIVVICGADDDYVKDGEAFASRFKQAHPEKILILAGYPAELTDQLKAAGVDEFIHLKADVIGTLSKLQQTLNIQ